MHIVISANSASPRQTSCVPWQRPSWRTDGIACARPPIHPGLEAQQVSRTGRSPRAPCSSGTCRCHGENRKCSVSPSAGQVARCRDRRGRSLFLCSVGISCTVPSQRQSFLPGPGLISGTRDNSKSFDFPGAAAGFPCRNAGTSCLHAGKRAGIAGCCPARHRRP